MSRTGYMVPALILTFLLVILLRRYVGSSLDPIVQVLAP